MNKSFVISVIFVALIILTGCIISARNNTPLSSSDHPEEGVEVYSQPEAEEYVTDEVYSGVNFTGTTSTHEVAIDRTVTVDLEYIPTETSIVIRTKLEATDPSKIILASGNYLLIEFFAFWCPTCQSMAPVIHKLEYQYSPRIKFVYLDIDDPATDKIKNDLGYKYQPHFILLDGQGIIIKQWLGFVTEDEFVTAFSTIP